MQTSKLILTALLFLSLPQAYAQEVMIKCFGVATAQKSDCDTNNDPATCNPSLIDTGPEYWVYLPQDVCTKLVGKVTITPPNG